MLIIFGGLPGTGKTTIARALAGHLGAVHLRIDSIEQAIRASGAVAGPMEDVGYRAAYALAEDNVRIGLTVIADSRLLRLSSSVRIRTSTNAGLRCAGPMYLD